MEQRKKDNNEKERKQQKTDEQREQQRETNAMEVWDGWSYASKLHRAHRLRRILIFLKSWTKIWDGTKCLKKEVVGVGEAWRGPAWSSRLAAQLMARRPFVCVPSRTSGQNLKCCPSPPTTETRGAPADRKAQNVSLCWNSRNTKQRIYILHKGFPGLNFTQGWFISPL